MNKTELKQLIKECVVEMREETTLKKVLLKKLDDELIDTRKQLKHIFGVNV